MKIILIIRRNYVDSHKFAFFFIEVHLCTVGLSFSIFFFKA